jgi:hypothetical protein
MASNKPLSPNLSSMLSKHIRPLLLANDLALESLLQFLSLRPHMRQRFLHFASIPS